MIQWLLNIKLVQGHVQDVCKIYAVISRSGNSIEMQIFFTSEFVLRSHINNKNVKGKRKMLGSTINKYNTGKEVRSYLFRLFTKIRVFKC